MGTEIVLYVENAGELEVSSEVVRLHGLRMGNEESLNNLKFDIAIDPSLRLKKDLHPIQGLIVVLLVRGNAGTGAFVDDANLEHFPTSQHHNQTPKPDAPALERTNFGRRFSFDGDNVQGGIAEVTRNLVLVEAAVEGKASPNRINRGILATNGYWDRTIENGHKVLEIASDSSLGLLKRHGLGIARLSASQTLALQKSVEQIIRELRLRSQFLVFLESQSFEFIHNPFSTD